MIHSIQSYTLNLVLRWFDRHGVDFVNGIPHFDGSVFTESEALFAPHAQGSATSRAITQLGMLASGGKDGGLFVVIGRKR